MPRLKMNGIPIFVNIAEYTCQKRKEGVMSKVKLRKKKISGGRQSLFLDIYPPVPHPATNKLTRKVYLELYIYQRPRIETERNHNKETLELAENIRAKRQIDVQNFKYDFVSSTMMKGNFIEWFESLLKGRSGSNLQNWQSAIAHFKEFAGEKVIYYQLNETFCEEYADYLATAESHKPSKKIISTNTCVSYFAKFVYALKEAYKKRLLPYDLGNFIDGITPEDTHREFLFLDELQALADTPCKSDLVKRAALLSAVTGLRFSDIQSLDWSEVKGSRGNYSIHFSVDKTRSAEYLPIPDQAYDLLGERGEKLVFKGLKYYVIPGIVREWLNDAGIKKHITFHCFRHTFATLQLLFGTDIVTVSKMLGHKDIKTTMIYVKIVDKLKREAADRITLVIDGEWLRLSLAS